MTGGQGTGTIENCVAMFVTRVIAPYSSITDLYIIHKTSLFHTLINRHHHMIYKTPVSQGFPSAELKRKLNRR